MTLSDELKPLSDAEKLQMLEALGVAFVPYKDSTGPLRWVVQYKEGTLLHKFDAQRLELMSEAVVVQAGLEPNDQYLHMTIPVASLHDLLQDNANAQLLIQVKLDDEGIVVDAYDHEARSIASVWQTYEAMGVEVRITKECG